MTDVIWGTVTDIIDGNSFKIAVTHRERSNKTEYQDTENIVISEIDVQEIPKEKSDRSKEVLDKYLKEKFVRCDIVENSNDGHLAKVSLSGIGGY